MRRGRAGGAITEGDRGSPLVARLFLGCPLPPEVALQLHDWAERELPGRIVPVENLHATLLFFGEQPAESVEKLVKLTEEMRWSPLPVVTEQVKRFGRNAVAIRLKAVRSGGLVVPLDLYAYLPQTGNGRKAIDLHVTLARFGRSRSDFTLPTGAPESEFSLDRATLYESQLGPDGARYVRLASSLLSE